MNKNIRAYSLVELSITISIVAMLLASGVTVFSKKSEIDRIKTTKEHISKIEQAISAYVDLNGFIPCPAKGGSNETDSLFGDSQTNQSYNANTHICTNNLQNRVGMVPVKNLLLENKYAYDGWGRQFSFVVATGMGNQTDFSSDDYHGDISVADYNGIEKTNLYKTYPNNFGAAYVIISFGADGFGAWSKNSSSSVPTTQLNNITYQNSRYLSSSTTPVYIQTPSKYIDFDDIVSFKLKTMLINNRPFLHSDSMMISSSMCDDAEKIVSAGKPDGEGFVDRLLAGTVSGYNSYTPSNTSLRYQIYKTAYNINQICNKQDNSSNCSFSPKNISGLKLWLDANDPNADGTSVSSTDFSLWYNKAFTDEHTNISSNGCSSTSRKGAQTKTSYNSNYQGTSKNTLSFVNNPNTSCLDYSISNLNNSYTIFVVDSVYASTGTVDDALLKLITNTSSLYVPLYKYGNSSYYPMVSGLLSKAASVSNYSNSTTKSFPLDIYPNVWTFTANKSKNIATFNTHTYRGTSSTDYLDVTSLTGIFNVTGIQLGPDKNTLSGYLHEIIIYDQALTPSQAAQVQGYLIRKWISGEC